MNLVGSVKAEVLCPAGCVVFGVSGLFIQARLEVGYFASACADEVVELAVREPDGILHRLERAFTKDTTVI